MRSLPTHRVSIAERKAANEELKEIFSVTDILVNEQLDRIMVQFKNTAPDLYAASNNARMIVHYSIRYEKEDKPQSN